MTAAFKFSLPQSVDASECALIFESRAEGTFVEEHISYQELNEELNQPLCDADRKTRAVQALEARPERARVLQLLRRLHHGLPTLLLHPALNAQQQAELVEKTRKTQCHSEALLLMATSGSSGSPKVVQLGAAALKAALKSSSDMHPLRKGDRWLLALPYAHIGGLSILLRCLCSGSCAVFPASKHPSSVLRLQITIASLVPTQLYRWLDSDIDFRGSKLRYQLIGGAPVTAELLQQARARGLNPLRTYGMTETCAQVATEPSFGAGLRPLSGVQVEIRDGEICLKSPQLMLGYLGHPSLERSKFFSTGDRGSYQEKLSVEGRLDACFISGGENISPEWAESQVGQITGIAEWALTWVADAQWGQAAVALYVPALTSSECLTQAEDAFKVLPAFARPKRFLSTHGLPRTSSGKWARSRFHALAEELAGAEKTITSPSGES